MAQSFGLLAKRNIMTVIKCQALYDLREVTAWVSGSDLHNLFTKITGNPSPKGSLLYDEDRGAKFIEGYEELMSEKNYSLLVGEIV